MRALAVVIAGLGLAAIAFALLNPELDVQFRAFFVEYRGNTLGLGLVLVAFASAGVIMRDVIKRIAAVFTHRPKARLANTNSLRTDD